MKKKLFNRIIELSGVKTLKEETVNFKVGEQTLSIDVTAEMQKLKERLGSDDASQVIIDALKVVKSDNDGYWDNDGIGAYEYGGARGYDKGETYFVPESCFVEAEANVQLSPTDILVGANYISGEDVFNNIGEAVLEMFTSDRNPDKDGYYSFEDPSIVLDGNLEPHMRPYEEAEEGYVKSNYVPDAKFKFEYADGVLKFKVFANYKDR